VSPDGLDTVKQMKAANRRGPRTVPPSAAPAVNKAAPPPPAPTVVATVPAPRTPPPEPGSPAAVPDGKTGFAALHRFAYRPDNPRFSYEYDPAQDAELRALGDTVEEFGIMQPGSVCSVDVWCKHHPQDVGKFHPDVWWIWVMGNRRFAIAQWMKLDDLSFIRNDSLGEPLRAKKAGLIENFHRKGYDPIQEAIEMESILRDEPGLSMRGLAKELGFTYPYVQARLQLLKLLDAFQALVSQGALTVQKALPIARLSNEDQTRLLELGEPYAVARLAGAESEELAPPLSTSKAVKIPSRSTPPDVVEVLAAKLEWDILREVTQLLAAKIADLH